MLILLAESENGENGEGSDTRHRNIVASAKVRRSVRASSRSLSIHISHRSRMVPAAGFNSSFRTPENGPGRTRTHTPVARLPANCRKINHFFSGLASLSSLSFRSIEMSSATISTRLPTLDVIGPRMYTVDFSGSL